MRATFVAFLVVAVFAIVQAGVHHYRTGGNDGKAQAQSGLLPLPIPVIKSAIKSVIPDIKAAAAPVIKAAIPDIKAALPDLKAAIPDIKAAIPDIKAAFPDIKAALPDIKDILGPSGRGHKRGGTIFDTAASFINGII